MSTAMGAGNRPTVPVPGSAQYVLKTGGVTAAPSSRWPDFLTFLWSSRAFEVLEEAKGDDVYSQFVGYPAEDTIVELSLSQVCSVTGLGSQRSVVPSRIG